MFELQIELKEKISNIMNEELAFSPLSASMASEDCSCKGGCGTYTPPCSCCAYNS